VARVGERRGAHSILGGDLRERDLLEDLEIDENIILKLTL